MACVLATKKEDKWICTSRQEECLFNDPNATRCAEMYGEGPEYNKQHDEVSTLEDIIDQIIDEEGDFQSEEDEIDNIANGNN